MYKIVSLALALFFVFSGCNATQQNNDVLEGKNSISCEIKKGYPSVDLEDARKEAEEYVQGVLGYKGKLSMEDACTFDLYNSFMFDEDYSTIMDFDKSDEEIQVGIEAFAKKYNIKNLDILYELLKLERDIMGYPEDTKK